MKKLVRKSVTWLLIFGMVFTPLVTSIDLVSANAEAGEISFAIGDSEYKFEENNLNDEAKNSVSAADTATKAAAAAETAATAAETAAQNATVSANTAAAAAGTDSNADTYKDSAIGIISDLNSNLNNNSEENPGLVQQIAAANAAYNDATSKVKAANDAITAADGLYQAALTAKRNASTKQEEADAAILLANAEKAKTDAMKTLADAEGVQGNYLTKLHQLQTLVTDADGLKTTADGLKTEVENNQASVDSAISIAEQYIKESITAHDPNSENASTTKSYNGIGYYDFWVQCALAKDSKADTAISDANDAIKTAAGERLAAAQAIVDVQTEKGEFEREVSELDSKTTEDINKLLTEVGTAVNDTKKFGKTAMDASDAALVAAGEAKQKAIEWGAKAEAEAARAEADANAAQNGLYTESRDALETYATAAATAASNARTYANAAQEAADAAARAEAAAKETYEYLLGIYKEADTALKKAQTSYNTALGTANAKVTGINQNVEAANSLVNTYDNTTIANVNEAITKANTKSKEANDGHTNLKGAEERATQKVKDTKGKIADADGKISEQEGKITDANTAIANYNAKAEAVRTAIQEYENALEYFNTELNKKDGTIETYNAAKAAIEAANEKINAAITAMEAANKAIPDVSEAKEAYNTATGKITAAANALTAAGTSLTNAQTQTEKAEQAAEDAKGFAKTAEQKANEVATKAAITEDVLAKATTGRNDATYAKLVSTAEQNDTAYQTALSEQPGKEQAAEEQKESDIQKASEDQNAAKNTANADRQKVYDAVHTALGNTEYADKYANKTLAEYESMLSKANSDIGEYGKEISPVKSLAETFCDYESMTKYEMALAIRDNGSFSLSYYVWKNAFQKTKKTKEFGYEYMSLETANQIIADYEFGQNAVKNLPESINKLKSAETAYTTAVGNADSAYNKAVGDANTKYNDKIQSIQEEVNTAKGNKDISDKELKAVQDYVARGVTQENTMVFTAEEAKLLSDLLADLKKGYGTEYNGIQQNINDFSYVGVNGDINQYKEHLYGAITTNTKLFDALFDLFSGRNWSKEDCQNKDKLFNKYTSIDIDMSDEVFGLFNQSKIEKKDDGNIAVLTELASDKCVLLCQDAEMISVLKATLAVAKAEEAKKTANDKKKEANDAAEAARKALNNYNDALKDLANALKLPAEDLVALNEKDIHNPFELTTADGENGKDFIVSYKDDEIVKPERATDENANGQYNRADDTTELTFDHTQYDNDKIAFNSAVEKFESDKEKYAYIYGDANKKELVLPQNIAEILTKLGLSEDKISAHISEVNFDVLGDLAGIVAEAYENYLAAKKVADEAEGIAKKAQEDADKADAEYKSAQGVLDTYLYFQGEREKDAAKRGGGEAPIVTAPTGFAFPTAGAATGVAGVRRAIGGGARRVAAAGDGTGEEVKTDAGQPKLVPLEEEEVKEEEKAPKKTQKTTTIEEDPLPAAAAAPEKAPFPWWLLLIVVAALGAGYAGYKYYDKKKNEDKIA